MSCKKVKGESHKAVLVSSFLKSNLKAALVFISHRAPCSDAKVESLALETAGQTSLSPHLTAP